MRESPAIARAPTQPEVVAAEIALGYRVRQLIKRTRIS
jgi:hypothetical protein